MTTQDKLRYIKTRNRLTNAGLAKLLQVSSCSIDNWLYKADYHISASMERLIDLEYMKARGELK